MPQFKTLQFPNTAKGQADKVRALELEAASGWRVVSETIVAGKFKTETACCFFMIFAPCAFLAGHEPDMITITLERPDALPDKTKAQDRQINVPPYDTNKWQALLHYDAEISTAASKIAPLGPKWLDHMASAYMALQDKSYLQSIVEKIQERAALEESEMARLASEEAEKRRVRQRKEEEDQRAMAARRVLQGDTDEMPWFQKYWAYILAAVLLLILAPLFASLSDSKIDHHKAASVEAVRSAPIEPITHVSPSFDCTKVRSKVLTLVCATPDLANLDNELAKVYAAARERSPDVAALRTEQRLWIRARNNSRADVELLRRLYRERIIALRLHGK